MQKLKLEFDSAAILWINFEMDFFFRVGGAKVWVLGIKGAYCNFYNSKTKTRRTEFGTGSWSIFFILAMNYFSLDFGGQNAAVKTIP